jgi:hypothetical protein
VRDLKGENRGGRVGSPSNGLISANETAHLCANADHPSASLVVAPWSTRSTIYARLGCVGQLDWFADRGPRLSGKDVFHRRALRGHSKGAITIYLMQVELLFIGEACQKQRRCDCGGMRTVLACIYPCSKAVPGRQAYFPSSRKGLLLSGMQVDSMQAELLFRRQGSLFIFSNRPAVNGLSYCVYGGLKN